MSIGVQQTYVSIELALLKSGLVVLASRAQDPCPNDKIYKVVAELFRANFRGM